jgi:hypothetical protein
MSDAEADAIAVLKILSSPDISVKHVVVVSKALEQGIEAERVSVALAFLAEMEWINEALFDRLELTETGRKEASRRGFFRRGSRSTLKVTDLKKDWIEMRSKLQQQLNMLEAGEIHNVDKIFGPTTTATVARLEKCISELEELLKEYAGDSKER